MSIIKSLSVGNGDMFYINHNSDNFTIIDCCMPDEKRQTILDEVRVEAAANGVVRFISTHPDQDHLCGLVELSDAIDLGNFYCVRNDATKGDGPTEDFLRYCQLRDTAANRFYVHKNCKRKWMNQNDETRGSSGISFLWPQTDSPHYLLALEDARQGRCPNNISTILRYKVEDGPSAMWMGDLDTDFMKDIEESVSLLQTDILFAPHHGRNSGRVPTSWLDTIQPKVIVVGEAPSDHLHYYPGYDTLTQNSAGDITFEFLAGKANIYCSRITYGVDFLVDENLSHTHGKYLGTLYI